MSEEKYDLNDIASTIRDAFFVRGYPSVYIVLLPRDDKTGIFYVVLGDDVVLSLIERGDYVLSGDTLTLVLSSGRPINLRMKKAMRKKD